MVSAFLQDHPLLHNKRGVFAHVLSRDCLESIVPLLRALWRERGVFVTGTPYPVARAQLHGKGVRTDRVFFVDVVSKEGKKELLSDHECVYACAGDLSGLSVVLQQLARRHDYVVLELDALLEKNSWEQVQNLVKGVASVRGASVHVVGNQYSLPPQFMDGLLKMSHGVLAVHP